MLQSLSFDEKVERDASALIFVLLARTFTFFGFLISLTNFRVFCLFRC